MSHPSPLRQAGITVKNLFISLLEENLGSLVPVLILILLLAVVLVCLKMSAPIAPFVYSLF